MGIGMRLIILYFAANVLLLGLYGCDALSESDTANKPTPPEAIEGSGTRGHHDHGDHGHNGDSRFSDMEKMRAELAKLSPEDAVLAEKQHMCPVSGEMLGTMGAPIQVQVDGQPVWICCEGCKKALLEDPSQYLAKLKTP